jgi:hypothetical protein
MLTVMARLPVLTAMMEMPITSPAIPRSATDRITTVISSPMSPFYHLAAFHMMVVLIAQTKASIRVKHAELVHVMEELLSATQ